jgi:membrane-bound acyltransferase YfiQ involved in biofilm formation
MLLPFLVEILPSNIGSFLNFSKDFNLIILGKTIGYFLIGYRLHKTPIRNKSILGDVLLVMLLASIIAVTNILNNLHYSNFPVIGYNSIISLIFSIEIFWLFKKWSTFHRISPKLEQITTLLSSLTFGIYLTHGAVMIYVHKIIQPNDYLLVFFLTVGLSFILTYTISKIPKLRYFLIGIE